MSEQHYDETFDFVVVGSGGGSMCAALLMRTLNKSVVILEKTDLVGGTTAYSGGVMWIPNNRFMAEAGLDDSYEKATAYMDATVGQSEDAPGAAPVRRAAYLQEGPKMVDFLVDQGIKLRRIGYYPDYYDERPGGSEPGRTVVAELFNLNELPKDWVPKLRPNFLPLPASLDELFSLATFKNSWAGKRTLAKVGFRGIMAKLTGKHWATAGAALQGRMLQAALKAKTEIRVDSAVKSLILDEGAVKGVVTVKEGKEWRIGARLGVLVNAGGFAQNQEMRDKYIPHTSAEWTGAREGDTGEMLREMMLLGADIAQMDETMGSQMAIPPGRGNTTGKGIEIGGVGGQMELAKPHAILVDQSGVRYMNEGGSYSEFCMNMRKRHATVPAIPSWWIMDAQYMKNYMFCGTMPGSKKPQEWYDTGWLKRAETIEGLAAACNLEPVTLKATVNKFNADVQAGKDTQFHRGDRAYDRWLGDQFHQPSATLGTIEQGPFYAVPMVPGDVGTCGGVVCDEYSRVLREDGRPIAGLYATGTGTASVMGRYAVGPGASIGPSFTWGYVAAKHAANAGNIIE
ncbi:3-oxosteroid 1-dehydrogenase [Acidocella aquatica]|uniref:3-oxosteroid 1-dehydrogenase n=1 Tax=Acidocella aquatica TaxID=1922313 RepID=A0ABQ6A833_9PROT|nr:FAD-binding protein [Acidocella aquatica]GLR67468.1 3-oxosteroid 1-dehydrogenase [Acidocella aquatica]